MAEVTVTYRSDLAEHIGTSLEHYEASTVKDVLKHIEKRHGKQSYKAAKAMLITVNGLSIQTKHYYATKLASGDTVGFYPLAAGG